MGLPIQLSHFSQEEVKKLAQCYGLNWEQGEHCQQLMKMVDGHPVLVQIALYHLSRGEITLEHLLKTSATNVGIYTNHLQRHWIILQQQPELHQTFKNILNKNEKFQFNPALTHKLSSLGLIKQLEDRLVPSSRLYQLFFENNY